MPFIDIKTIAPIEPAPGCHMRTPFGENLMLSYLEMDAGAEVPLHSHPHEQGGILIKGRMQLTIGDETRICEAGSMFIIPPNVKHRAVAIDGPAVVLDCFSPVREDYAAQFNKYIPPVEKPRSWQVVMSALPRLAVTMGDAGGVGPELCLRLLANEELTRLCTPIIFGDAEILRRAAAATGQNFAAPVMLWSERVARFAAIQQPTVCDFAALDVARFKPGVSDAQTGAASFTYINAAIDTALAKQVIAVTTAPVSKEALHAAGHKYPGHTEIFANRTNAERSCMMQYSDEITCSFVTTHVGYHEVPKLLTVERVQDVIELTDAALRRIRGKTHTPKIVVCGLNPHAGEHGLFGNEEEERIIEPAIAACRKQGMNVEGPLPGDTAFIVPRRRSTDAFVCMYHDQGHIPVKALAFDRAVNTTLGLPIVRTSVDHGTALDIAWQGKADPGSLFSAVRLAVQLGT